jgi:hypothetical protein
VKASEIDGLGQNSFRIFDTTKLNKEVKFMKTCGYDMLLELDEKLLNKALAVVFYTGMLKASGSYSFVDGIPEELQGFTKIKYKVRLKNEPYVDLKETDKVFLKLSVELFLTVLTSVEVELDVDFHAIISFYVGFSVSFSH